MKKPAAQPTLLPVVMLALAAFAVLRAADIWIGVTGAEAAEESGAPIPVDALSAEAPEAAPVEAPVSEAERRILERLAARRADLDRREEEIETRERLIEAAELQLEARLAGLASEREEIERLRSEQSRRQAEEFENLSSAYERMKPRDAARIFEVLEADILVPVAAGMRTQSLSGVLAEMQPDKARILTRLLADHRRKTGGADSGQ